MSSPVTLPALDVASLNRLKWSCRRGLLENDLLLERFFSRHGSALTLSQAQALEILMDLPDNDLLDLFLGRVQPQAELDQPGVRDVLALIRVNGAQFRALEHTPDTHA
jgi:antitoxin CptB